MNQIREYQNKISANEHENTLMKQRLEKILQENRHLTEETSNAQEQLRMSAGQMTKLRAEISQMK